MKNKKKFIISIIGLIIIIGLIRGDLEIETNFSDKDDQDEVQITEEELKEYINEDPDYVDYYDNLEDALNKSRLTNYMGVTNIIKTFEIGSNIVIFVTKHGDENEELSRYRLKIKDSRGHKEYSHPLEGISTDYANIKSSSNKIGKMMEGKEGTRLWRNFIWHNKVDLDDPVNVVRDKHKNFKWSVTDIENVKHLEIKGKRPDEIISFNLDGNELYFYYYLDLEVDINEMEKRGSEDFKIKK